MAAKHHQQQSAAAAAPLHPPPMSGETFAALEGMSRSQIYDLMSKMKLLIDQNQQQARKVLIDNPLLTKALFQAQIMLGMVKPPESVPNNSPQTSSQAQPSHSVQQLKFPSSQSLPAQAGQPVQASPSQTSVMPRQQPPIQPSNSFQSLSLPSMAYPSAQMRPIPTHPGQQRAKFPQPLQHNKGYANSHVPSATSPQNSQIHTSSQVRNLPPPPPPQNYSIPQSHLTMASNQGHQSLPSQPVLHQSIQPPIPQQPRPPSMQPFPHQMHSQMHSQMPHSHGFQQAGMPQQFTPQPIFHQVANPQTSFPRGQPPLSSQHPQQLYQGNLHIASDYGNQAGGSMVGDRGGPWASSHMDKPTPGLQLPGPPPVMPGQISTAPGGQPPRPPPLTPDVEKALLQQVMSLTPEQINLLPPEQQSQVLKLQEMLR